VAATSGLGAVTVKFSSLITLESVAGIASVGSVNIWGLVDDAQTPGWQSITDSQTPGWQSVVDSQSPGWTAIAA